MNGLPATILDEPGSLTPSETERMRMHAYCTERMLGGRRPRPRASGAGNAPLRRGEHRGDGRPGGGRPVHDRSCLAGDRGRHRGDRPSGPARAGRAVPGVRRKRRSGVAVRGLHEAAGYRRGEGCAGSAHRRRREGGRGDRRGGEVGRLRVSPAVVDPRSVAAAVGDAMS